MIIIIGLVILIAAVAAGVLTNSGSGHALTRPFGQATVIHMPTGTSRGCPETRHEMEADGDGHALPGDGAALRRPARRLLR